MYQGRFTFRLFTMREAIQDFYALQRLEQLYGKDFAMRLLKDSGLEGLSKYLTNAGAHILLRKKINRYILGKEC